MVHKWDELTAEEQTRALQVNIAGSGFLDDIDTARKETAFIQLVSTGPYYFDKQGKVYTGPAITVCPKAKDIVNRIAKYDYKTGKTRYEVTHIVRVVDNTGVN